MRAFLVIDVQKGLTARKLYEKDRFIETINQAIARFREKNEPVVFVQHQNKQLMIDTEEWEIDEQIKAKGKDWFFDKTEGDAFANPDLVEKLHQHGVTDVVVAGLVTHGCVSYTCKGGIKRGFAVSLLRGAHTCWNADAKEKITQTEKVLTELGVKVIEVKAL